MKVQYFALLRDITGKREEDWRQPAATVGDLLRALVARYGHEFERWVMKDNDLWDLGHRSGQWARCSWHRSFQNATDPK